MQVDKEAFEYAISKIDDGEIFEKFATNFLSAELGHEFIPVGGTKDRGVDSFQHVFSKNGKEKIIYQISTEIAHEAKIESTINKLNENGIVFSRLIYVTNRKINQAEAFVDKILDEQNVYLTIYDIRWFISNCNNSQSTINAYQIFVDTFLHEYSKPGNYQTIANLDSDSRLYVFLGQQFEKEHSTLKIDNLLAETLILYALEGTDPDKGVFKTLAEIKLEIRKYLKFDPKLIDQTINEQISVLIKKPRKIKYHSTVQGYCLPYETRVEIEERNLQDELLYSKFFEETEVTIRKYFDDIEVNVRDIAKLIQNVFNKLFLRQGLEFSNFVLHGNNQDMVEQKLHDVIGGVVDDSSVIIKNKEKVKISLNLAIRDIVYNGTENQRRFLKGLSNTYLMMFLLKWEPKLSTYFQTLASQLKVFVDNSIIVPALSEYYLPDGNKRHWNLLVGAHKAGISLFINETLLDELVSHFKMIRNKYYAVFHLTEEFYLSEESELLYIDEIIIRAYFYAKKGKRVSDFDSFINNFVDPSLKNLKQELIIYLKEVLHIEYISNSSWDINIDGDEKAKLSETLKHKKNNEIKAENDAEMILAIYNLREKGNEQAENGIFGYKTWWLSKDTATYRAVSETFGDKYPISCYIRPDFVYNYIALKPSSEEVDDAYNEIFPTMLGVNLSYHMPKEISQSVQQKIQEYHDKPPVRVKQILRNLTDKLKTDPSMNNKSVEHYLDEQLRNINNEDSQ
jgi:hypothetical protein